MEYPIANFIEILNDLHPTVIFVRDQEHLGVKAKIYQNRSGKSVYIEITDWEDGFVDDFLGKNYLRQLELFDLIDVLFPPPNALKN